MTTDELVARLLTLKAAPTIAAIEGATGLDPDGLADLIVEAEAAGLVEGLEADGEASVLLSPLACERAGVVLACVDESRGEWAWKPADWEPPPERRRGRGEYPAEAMDRMESPAPGPVEAAAEPEAVERVAAEAAKRAATCAGAVDVDRLPTPRHLLGSTTPWDGPTPECEACPVCNGRPLAFLEMCLKCGRARLDHNLPRLRLRPPKAVDDSSGLAGGTGAKRPKAGRKKVKAA